MANGDIDTKHLSFTFTIYIQLSPIHSDFNGEFVCLLFSPFFFRFFFRFLLLSDILILKVNFLNFRSPQRHETLEIRETISFTSNMDFIFFSRTIVSY